MNIKTQVIQSNSLSFDIKTIILQACQPSNYVLSNNIAKESLSLQNHIYSKKNLRQFLSRLDSVWYGYSAKQKNMQQTGTDTGHWINMLVPKIV